MITEYARSWIRLQQNGYARPPFRRRDRPCRQPYSAARESKEQVVEVEGDGVRRLPRRDVAQRADREGLLVRAVVPYSTRPTSPFQILYCAVIPPASSPFGPVWAS